MRLININTDCTFEKSLKLLGTEKLRVLHLLLHQHRSQVTEIRERAFWYDQWFECKKVRSSLLTELNQALICVQCESYHDFFLWSCVQFVQPAPRKPDRRRLSVMIIVRVESSTNSTVILKERNMQLISSPSKENKKEVIQMYLIS